MSRHVTLLAVRDDLDMKLTWEWFTAWYFIATRLVTTRANDKSHKVHRRLCHVEFYERFCLFYLFCVLRTAGFESRVLFSTRSVTDGQTPARQMGRCGFTAVCSFCSIFQMKWAFHVFFFHLIFWNCVWASHLLWELENILILYRTDPDTRIRLFAFRRWDIHSTMLTLKSISSKLLYKECRAS